MVGWALAAALLAPLAPAAVLHVSPGGNDGTGDGSTDHPFSSIERAVAALASEAEPVVVLEAGTYASPQYAFPVNLELNRSLTLRGPSGGEAILLGTKETEVLKITVTTPSPEAVGRTVITLEGLQVKGGLTGLSVIGSREAKFEARVLKCRFSDQRYQGAELVAGERGLLKAEISGNRIEGGPAFGFDLGTRLRGSLELKVVDNLVEGPKPDGATSLSSPPHYGLAVYSDVAARVAGEFSRNALQNAGLLILSQKAQGDPGAVDLLISNCLIAGDPSPERNRLQDGIHLSINQDDSTRIRFLNNTVVHSIGWGIFEEPQVAAIEHPENINVVVSDNIFWEMGKGDFSAEIAGGELPAYYRELRKNLVSASGRAGKDGNFSADPGFGPGYELSDGSPALEADALAADPVLATDLIGHCRLADGDGDGLYHLDLGALEKAGPCAADARDFVRGDCQGDGTVDLTDPVASFLFLFVGGFTATCSDACDADDNGKIEITDGISLLSYLFLGGQPPPAPFPLPAKDTTADALGPCR